MSSLVNVNKQGKVAVLELNRKPVNSFSLDFLQEINAELDKLETDHDCQGLIITSVCLKHYLIFFQKFDKANVLFFEKRKKKFKKNIVMYTLNLSVLCFMNVKLLLFEHIMHYKYSNFFIKILINILSIRPFPKYSLLV